MSYSCLTKLENGFTLGGYLPRALDASASAPTGFEGDKHWMAEALVEAMAGQGLSNPNPTVGAVIVKDQKIVSRGHTQAYGSFHAERMAIKNGKAEELRGATCYVTLEPCGGTGQQGPCADALIAAGIKRVVVGTADPHAKAGGLGLDKLKAAGITLTLDVLAAECRAWHFPFLTSEIKGSPVIIGKWAQTLDGHLAADNGGSQWISGPEARAYTHWLRQKYDAILVGVGTVLADAPRLTARDSALPHHRHPHKIIYDPEGRLNAAPAKVWENLWDGIDGSGTRIFWCTKPGAKTPAAAQTRSTTFFHLPTVDVGSWSNLWRDLQTAFAQNHLHALRSIMVEGGPALLTLLARADQLDACHIFIRTGLLGGAKHRIGRLDRGENPTLDLMQRRDYALLTSQTIAEDVLIECVKRTYLKP